MNTSLSALVPENLVSRGGFGSPIPRQRAHPHPQAESGAYLLCDAPERQSHGIYSTANIPIYIPAHVAVEHFHIVTNSYYSPDGNLSASGEEDSQLEQGGSPLASGQEEMASNLRVVVDISSSRRSFNWLFWGVGTWMLRSLSVICLCYRYS